MVSERLCHCNNGKVTIGHIAHARKNEQQDHSDFCDSLHSLDNNATIIFYVMGLRTFCSNAEYHTDSFDSFVTKLLRSNHSFPLMSEVSLS